MKKIFTTCLSAALLLPAGAVVLNPVLKNGEKLQAKEAESREIVVTHVALNGSKAPAQKIAMQAPARVAAVPENADMPLLYGFNYRTFDHTTISPLSIGVYSFHPAENIVYFDECVTDDFGRPIFAVYADGKFYMFKSNTSEAPASVTVYDATTWQLLQGPVTFGDSSGQYQLRQAGAWYPGSQYIYFHGWGDLDWNTFKMNRPMYRMDINTLEVEKVADMTQGDQPTRFLQVMFFDAEGQLYGIEYNTRKLYSIDTATAYTTEVKKPGTDENVVLNPGFNLAADPMSAVADPATGDIYWMAVNGSSKQSALCKIDSEYELTVVANVPTGEHLLGLYIPYVAPGAPAATTGNRYADGKVTFTVPTTYYTLQSDEPLTGLTAVLTIDGKVTEKAVTAGETVEMSAKLDDGKHTISTYVKNSAGNGPERRYVTFVGKDLPGAVENLKYELDSNVATLTWDAPTTTLNNGPLDDAAVNYTIVRWPDEVIVAQGITETSFTETVPERRDHYAYEVIAYADAKVGASVKTEPLPGGVKYIVPFTEDFQTQNDFDQFKVYDVNEDGQTWYYVPVTHKASLVGNGVYSSLTGFIPTYNDDYLVSLPIVLEANIDYRLTIDFEQISNNETLDVLLGTSNQVTGSERKLEQLFLPWGDFESRSIVFSVETAGEYNLFFHSVTVGNSSIMSLTQFAMEIEGAFDAPAQVTNLTATAGDKGELTNTISFVTPQTTYAGADLDEITKIEIYREDSNKPVKTYLDPKPFTAYKWVDADVEQGEHTYAVVPFNSKGQGATARITNWVGVDVPAIPANVKAKMTTDIKPCFVWDETTAEGRHGGYVDTDDVKYRLYKYNEYSWDNHWQIALDNISDIEAVHTDYFNYGSPEYPYQEYMTYAVVAYNAVGESEYAIVGVNVGHPYSRPYKESFGFYGMAETSPWTIHADTYPLAWAIADGEGMAVKPYDQDGGMLQFTHHDNSSNSHVIEGPRVSLKDSQHPELAFYMWHGNEADKDDTRLLVYANVDDAGFVKIAEADYNNGVRGWARHSFDLPTDADNVMIAFGADTYDASASIFVDDITIDEGVEYEVALDNITADKRVTKGEAGHVTVAVANLGQKDSGKCVVTLYRDGAEYDQAEIGNVARNSVAQVTFDVPTTITDGGNTFTFNATVACDNDTNADNNSSADVTMYVTGSLYPTVEDLDGETTLSGVALTWSMPSSEYIEDVTDTFEDYEAFIIDEIGDWTTYDGDGYVPLYFNGPAIPNAFEPQAWQVWNPELAGFSLEKFSVLVPKSGDQYLANWAATDGYSSTLANDDWLISCEVLGGSDVSFWTRMPNEGSSAQKYEVLYSTTDAEPENFEVLEAESIEGTTDWTYHIYTLPVDAKYFAIRSCGDAYTNRTVWFVDDLCYTPAYGSKGELKLVAFNVYCDDELIGSTTETAYTDADTDLLSHTYYVTACWDKGESLAGNSYQSKDLSSIQSVSAAKVRVAGSKGVIFVTNAAGQSLNVYGVDGSLICSQASVDNTAINVASGLYIVRVGSTTVKVIVD